MVCNISGKIYDMPTNFHVIDEDLGYKIGTIYGDVFFCNRGYDDFEDITEEKEYKVKKSFLIGSYVEDYFYI